MGLGITPEAVRDICRRRTGMPTGKIWRLSVAGVALAAAGYGLGAARYGMALSDPGARPAAATGSLALGTPAGPSRSLTVTADAGQGFRRTAGPREPCLGSPDRRPAASAQRASA